MVNTPKDRTDKLFTSADQQLPDDVAPQAGHALYVHAPYSLKLTPSAPDVDLIDLIRWAEQEHGMSQDVISALSYTLLFRLIGVDGLVEAATQEEWLQLTREIKDRLKK